MNIIQSTVDEFIKNEIIEFYYNSKSQFHQTTLEYLRNRLSRYGKGVLIYISDCPISQSTSSDQMVLYFQSKKEYVFICLIRQLFKEPPNHGQNIQCSLRGQEYKLNYHYY
ncbi:unnamed protein product [Paramecium pentaurelia]|uniref:Uncharacterized protein n=1 Tax=Paramecium pentaurelia TaxID=43138 RepID=A0A8S1VSY0_9CILI|nr:unnamed protein product [Paramecium pentaurelia]